MAKISAGLLMYRIKNRELEIFLVHPGGPFWKNKDLGAWSIPKGEVKIKEDFLETAQREFEEETGIMPKGKFIPLGEIKQKSGKIVHAWAFEGNWDGFLMKQNFIEIKWPPKSGKKIKIPEVDKLKFFNTKEAKKKINPAQVEFIKRLERYLKKGN